MSKDNILREFDLTVTEITHCYEDITLNHKWKNSSYNVGEYYVFMLGIGGRTILTVDGVEYPIGKNDVFFMPENTIYSGRCTEIPARIIVLKFKATDVSGFTSPFVITPKKRESYEELFFSIKEKLIVGVFGYRTELKSMLYTILNKAAKDLVLESGEERCYRKIKNSLLYIYENYSELDMSIAKAAEASNMSEVHFRRVFKDVFKTSPLSYVTEIRIKKAKELLSHTEYLVGEIANMVGIYDEVYFSKFFKKNTGRTPNEYRKIHSKD